jgi:hypothetical protein
MGLGCWPKGRRRGRVRSTGPIASFGPSVLRGFHLPLLNRGMWCDGSQIRMLGNPCQVLAFPSSTKTELTDKATNQLYLPWELGEED